MSQNILVQLFSCSDYKCYLTNKTTESMHLAPTVIISENNCVPDYFFLRSLRYNKIKRLTSKTFAGLTSLEKLYESLRCPEGECLDFNSKGIHNDDKTFLKSQ